MNKRTVTAGIISIVILVLFGGLLLSINSRLSNLQEEISERNSTFRNEVDTISSEADLIRQNLLLINRDSNNIQKLLNLPPSVYPLLSETDTELSDVSNDITDENLLFFKAVEMIVENQQNEEKMRQFNDFITSENMLSMLEERDMTADIDSSGLSAKLSGSHEGDFLISVQKENYKIQSIIGPETDISDVQETAAFIDKNLDSLSAHKKKWETASKELNSLIEDEGIQNLLESRKSMWMELDDNHNFIASGITDFNKKILLSIIFYKSENFWELSGPIIDDIKKYDAVEGNFTALTRDIISALTSYDSREPGEIAQDESAARLLELTKDDGFLSYLNSFNQKIKPEFREDHYYLYLDILDEKEQRTGSMAVQKHTGEIYLMDCDDVIITSLKTLGMNEGITVKKKLDLPENYATSSPVIFGENDIAFVLIGANEANTDTMMVVHINSSSGKGTIITIPRDLYYNGRKINSVYPTFGAEALMSTLSEITGLPVKRYVFIDMFAFADVVDILGGIDIILEEPLIDPTYRVKENGKWGTLHYEAGPLHLGGVEALRVARSRHTSSDFGRAERQQMILMALKDRFMDLNAADAAKFVELTESLMNYIKTDFSVLEILNIFTRFRNYPFSRHVLSWDNVLYNTYSNLYLLDDETEVGEDYNRGAWILMPLENDWEVIKWYVRKIISEEQEE